MGRGGNTRKNSVGSKDQDTGDGAIKEGCEEIKMQGIRNANSSRAWETVPTERRCDQGGVQFLKIWSIRGRIWASSVGGGEGRGMDQQLRGPAAFCRGPEFGF